MNQQSNLRFRLGLACLFSVLFHAAALGALWLYPAFTIALGLRHLEFVEEDYNQAILIDFSQPLAYPAGYAVFRAPQQAAALDKVKAEEERRRRSEARRRARELERQREEAARREAEERARAEEQAKNQPQPTPTPDKYAGGFGKINTRPIKDQIQRLYRAKQEGKLVLQEGRLRVGVAGKINSDGSLADYRIIISSDHPEIDAAALAILAAVSESRALAPLHELTSLSMILDIDQQAQLSVVGFTSSEQGARAIEALANLALWDARRRKAEDPAVLTIINSVQVSHTGQRVQAKISMPRQVAAETLARSMEKDKS
jgi:hypothetical protein